MDVVDEIKGYLLEFQVEKVGERAQVALDQGIDAKIILHQGLIAGMNVIGEQFKENEIFIPQVLLAAKAMNTVLGILEPFLAGAGREPLARIVLGTVKMDVHDIGKNLVGIMLKGAGFEVHDIGIDVPPQKFVQAARQHQARMVCMSSLITTSMPSLKASVEVIKSSGLEGKIKTMIGGAVVTQRYADEIGADGYAPDAGSAVGKVKEL